MSFTAGTSVRDNPLCGGASETARPYGGASIGINVKRSRAGVPDNKGRPALLYTLQFQVSLFVRNL